MNITIKQETSSDYRTVETLIKSAFETAEYTDHDEHNLVARLRKSDALIPELSLLAMIENDIVGHILFTKVTIHNGKEKRLSLALAPVAVLPNYQGKGIGSKLILEGINRAKSLGFGSVIVLGHKDYYPRFGFVPASKYGIMAPFEVPNEAFMALELKSGALHSVTGTVEYAKEFFT
ncbi:GNAT family N-acetyltransferase [Peribacillus loiseleuriae]|uniref:GCN5 family acetyltransferase n=1 Tax=Peribacillus loiseleuriae TaxID=1679170 RepID=A0A0K9GPX7_9BACI|nr:N-acetyltransferase [Peribacillus loiseleuriae]KMY48749.1 GCN5 family acetyltransferase [Peribacillus loiseleuriae]